jgi:hypothetical protein
VEHSTRFGPGLAAFAAIAVAMTAVLDAVPLRPETARGWDAYVRATEARIARELGHPQLFLATDFTSAVSSSRALARSGRVGVAKVTAVGGEAAGVVPEGLVHHWRGLVLIPGTTIDAILARVADPRDGDLFQDDVVASRVIDRGPGSLRLFLRLQRSQLITVVYNTEHAIQYRRHDARRASSRSVATRIAEVAEPGTARERELAPGQDRGFLWRLNSYWRYEQAAGGVLVECESISLSRTVPPLVRSVVQPVTDQIARGSMERTLEAMRTRFTRTSGQGD